MKIICIDAEAQYKPIIDRDVIPLLQAEGHEFTWYEGNFANAKDTIIQADGYDALYVIGDQGPVPSGLMRANPRLKHISFVGTGAVRFVDMTEAAECGVTVTNVPDFASQSVAEQAMALIFGVARRLAETDRDIRNGVWEKKKGMKLQGSILGVVGAGAIGKRLISMARGIGMEVVYWTYPHEPAMDEELGANYVELPELFASSDVVSVHLAQHPDTIGLVSKDLLTSMKEGAIFVNNARAEVVDHYAMIDLVNKGHLFGVGIDVYPVEPPSEKELPSADVNSVVTPHVAFHTDEADRVFETAALNTIALYAGRPQNVIS